MIHNTKPTPARRRQLAMARILTNIRQLLELDPSETTADLIEQHTALLQAMYRHHLAASATETSEVTEPTEALELSEPSKPIQPSQPSQPFEPFEPSEPVESPEPSKSPEPTAPSENSQPSQPTIPSTTGPQPAPARFSKSDRRRMPRKMKKMLAKTVTKKAVMQRKQPRA